MKKIYKIVIIIIAVIALIVGGFYGYKRYKRYKSYKEDAVFLLDFLEDNFCFNNHLRQINSSEVPKAHSNKYNLDGFEVFKQTQNIEPHKDSIKFKGNIYILVDESVYSASEYFVDIAKRSGVAKIIGTTTGGDGTGFEPIATYLPNSKLVVKMPPAFTISDDGTVNEEIHTELDIYIEQSLEDYKKFLKSGLQDITRSEYDTVYRKALEMIKK